MTLILPLNGPIVMKHLLIVDKRDLRVLFSFGAKDLPPELLSKPTALAAGYMVNDASGTGLGSSLFVSDKKNGVLL